MGVLLKHWKRITNSASSWEKVVSKLDEADAAALERLKKKTASDTPMAAMKVLKKHDSEVTVDSFGFPKMTAMSQDGGADEEEETKDEASHSTNLLEESPPPVTEKDWRGLAGKVKKKPASKKGPKNGESKGGEPCKRAGSDVGSGTRSCRRAGSDVGSGSCAMAGPPNFEKVLIDQDTIGFCKRALNRIGPEKGL